MPKWSAPVPQRRRHVPCRMSGAAQQRHHGPCRMSGAAQKRRHVPCRMSRAAQWRRRVVSCRHAPAPVRTGAPRTGVGRVGAPGHHSADPSTAENALTAPASRRGCARSGVRC
eukprot:gene12580-biopygen6672